jgi:hypothetical protein
VAIGVPFGERRKAEVLSMLRNKRMRWCCHCGCHQFSAHLGVRMVTFVTMWKETVNSLTSEKMRGPNQLQHHIMHNNHLASVELCITSFYLIKVL